MPWSVHYEKCFLTQLVKLHVSLIEAAVTRTGRPNLSRYGLVCALSFFSEFLIFVDISWDLLHGEPADGRL